MRASTGDRSSTRLEGSVSSTAINNTSTPEPPLPNEWRIARSENKVAHHDPVHLAFSLRDQNMDTIRDTARRVNDPAIAERIAQYELAFRMQMSVPDLTDVKSEPQHIRDMYGPDVAAPGRYAYNCLLARRLAERGVRFIQLYHRGWDAHGHLAGEHGHQCKDLDPGSAPPIKALNNRGIPAATPVLLGG